MVVLGESGQLFGYNFIGQMAYRFGPIVSVLLDQLTSADVAR
jgi:hypothetical protein